MDLGTLILSMLACSILINVVLMYCLFMPSFGRSAHAKTTEETENPEECEQRRGKLKAQESAPSLPVRQRHGVDGGDLFHRNNDVIIFPNHGMVYHKYGCKHVQKGQGKSRQMKAFAPCKDCVN
mmetsp:Transcript_7428/g.12782  ORF Transcript_7428/g.12782 Transcript_7428/m.12782 type:complete len:124 (-) Transcript_7428:91-462(-)